MIIDEDSATISWARLDQCKHDLLCLFTWLPVSGHEVAETITFHVHDKIDTRPKMENLLLEAVEVAPEHDHREVVRKEHIATR